MAFHVVIVFGLGYDILFKFNLGHCGSLQNHALPLAWHGRRWLGQNVLASISSSSSSFSSSSPPSSFFSSSLVFVRGCQIANNSTQPFSKWPQFLKIRQSLTGPNVLADLSSFSSPFTSSSRCYCLFSSSFFKFIRGCQINNTWSRPEPFFLGCIRCFLH